jgi:hypothetical protein
VVDKQPLAYFSAGVDLNTRQKAGQVGDKPGHNKPASPVKTVGYAVHNQGMETGIAEQYLKY